VSEVVKGKSVLCERGKVKLYVTTYKTIFHFSLSQVIFSTFYSCGVLLYWLQNGACLSEWEKGNMNIEPGKETFLVGSGRKFLTHLWTPSESSLSFTST